MLFPFLPSRSKKDFENPGDRIDRHLADRTQRLSAGLSIGSDFDDVLGSLLVSRGRGKYIRISHARCVQTSIPSSIAIECQQISASGESENLVSAARLAQIKYDLAEIQAQTAEKLKAQAGKYVDRLLSVSVSDPGYWSVDFDGQTTCIGLCDADRLAELSGLTVIDGFPARDLSVGGNGRPLSTMPLWLLLADRNSRIAQDLIAIFKIGASSEVFILPPSDGLDAEIPAIKYVHGPGTDLIELLLENFLPRVRDDDGALDTSTLYVNGKQHLPLIDAWSELFQADGGASELKLAVTRREKATAQSSPGSEFLEIANEFRRAHQLPFSTLFRSGIALIGKLLREQTIRALNRQGATNDLVLPTRIWVTSKSSLEACFINQVQQTFSKSEIKSTLDLGFNSEALSAVVAAILGLMHIDQMPANIPWITGADSQRILGRLTPGRPSAWRQLVMDMADFQPPAMKLKDAV